MDPSSSNYFISNYFIAMHGRLASTSPFENVFSPLDVSSLSSLTKIVVRSEGGQLFCNCHVYELIQSNAFVFGHSAGLF